MVVQGSNWAYSRQIMYKPLCLPFYLFGLFVVLNTCFSIQSIVLYKVLHSGVLHISFCTNPITRDKNPSTNVPIAHSKTKNKVLRALSYQINSKWKRKKLRRFSGTEMNTYVFIVKNEWICFIFVNIQYVTLLIRIYCDLNILNQDWMLNLFARIK